jgi:hypothetical protein
MGRDTLGRMTPARLASLALLLAACGGLSDGEDEPAPEPQPAPAETTEPEPSEPPPECDVGERRCSGQVREMCLRDGWTTIEVCEERFTCHPTHCRPEGT